jgi:adenosylcobinamide-phosphate synthase
MGCGAVGRCGKLYPCTEHGGPARVGLVGRSGYWPPAWNAVYRNGHNHPSPNSSYPEAVMTGMLGVRLGGPGSYGAVINPKQFIGDAKNVPDKKCIEKSVRLMYCATLLAATTASPEAAAINLPFEANFS